MGTVSGTGLAKPSNQTALERGRTALSKRSIVPADAVIDLRLDDATMKKTGRHIQGADHYRNGAGTARQEYRTLWGINLVWAIMCLLLPLWPGHHLSLPS